MSNLALVQDTTPAPLSEEERTIWRLVRDSFLESKRNKSGSADTFKDYKGTINAFVEACGEDPLAVSRQELESFINAPNRGRKNHGLAPSVATRKRTLAVVRSYYSYIQNYTVPGPNGRPRRLVSSDFIPPTHGVENGKPPRNYRALSMSELEAIFSQIPDDVRGKRDKSFLVFALLTGRRRSELEALTWSAIEQIEFSGDRVGRIYHYRGKGAKNQDRTKELPATCWELLIDYLRAAGRHDTMQADSPLWTCMPSWRGPGGFYTAETTPGQKPLRTAGYFDASTRLSGQAMNEVFQRYAAAAGIDPERAVLHGLRHTIARERYRLSRDPRAIMRFLDHSSLQVTTTYLEELVTADDPDVAKMEAHFSFLKQEARV